MKTIAPVEKIDITRWKGQDSEQVSDLLAMEVPLQVRLQYGAGADWQEKELLITMRTPGHDFDWAMGFLWTEGIIQRKEDVILMRYCKRVKAEEAGNVLMVKLSPDVNFDPAVLNRNFLMNSSCGICGKSAIEAVSCDSLPLGGKGTKIRIEVLHALLEQFNMEQTVFKYTGGIHAAALFESRNGKLVLLREDVGRHNALDKLIGAALHLLDTCLMEDCLLLLSGRVSFELVQKAVKAGIPVMAAVGAPSNLAVSLARKMGVTLIGFLKSEGFNVYSVPERIIY